MKFYKRALFIHIYKSNNNLFSRDACGQRMIALNEFRKVPLRE